MAANEQGTFRVQITSVDGNTTHPFHRTDTVRDVHGYGYDKLVQDKSAVPLSSTTMEFNGTPVADTEPLAALVGGGKQPGNVVDLSLALTWASQGG